ncbi:expressed unknown protein [Seminavis robusta]|uniref:Uncharacterized protein n=1 Tax=Seminavis robusta TaxID=568900 RepID=A0A9N8HY59_9STRA|nr:expressed unknown protein [Seminavis robusta]|eukprot:Sro1939_g306560.1 n/a (185) ;mRNA; r:7614-8168
MTTHPTAAADAIAKRVRFSPFVTFLGDEPEPPPEMEESLRMDGSFAANGSVVFGRRSSLTNSSNGQRRRSIDMNDMERQFGNVSLGGAFPLNFSATSCDLDVSAESIIEEDNESDEDPKPQQAMEDMHNFAGSLDVSFQSDSSFPPMAQIPAAAIEISGPPPAAVDHHRRRATGDGNVAVGTAA